MRTVCAVKMEDLTFYYSPVINISAITFKWLLSSPPAPSPVPSVVRRSLSL